MDFNEVKEWIEENKGNNEELKTYLGGFINKDSVNEFLTREEGKSIIDSIGNKAVTAYQGKGELKRIEKAVNEAKEKLRKELNPEETAEQKELREIKEKLAQQEADSLRKELQLQTNSLFSQKGYNPNLAKFVKGENIKEITQQADELNTLIQTVVAKQVEETLKDGYKPPKNNNSNNTDLSKLKPTEMMSMAYKNNNNQ